MHTKFAISVLSTIDEGDVRNSKVMISVYVSGNLAWVLDVKSEDPCFKIPDINRKSNWNSLLNES